MSHINELTEASPESRIELDWFDERFAEVGLEAELDHRLTDREVARAMKLFDPKDVEALDRQSRRLLASDLIHFLGAEQRRQQLRSHLGVNATEVVVEVEAEETEVEPVDHVVNGDPLPVNGNGSHARPITWKGRLITDPKSSNGKARVVRPPVAPDVVTTEEPRPTTTPIMGPSRPTPEFVDGGDGKSYRADPTLTGGAHKEVAAIKDRVDRWRKSQASKSRR